VDAPSTQGHRGWNGTTASHDFNWFDPVEGTAEPFDDNKHGSHTTGTMHDGVGNQIGVAPGARWIAYRRGPRRGKRNRQRRHCR
jgi:bacillopeptidase F